MAGTLRRLGIGARRGLARLPAPPKQLLRRQPMPTRNIRNDGPGNKRLLNNARFVVIREPATSARSRDHLQPAYSLRLKRMVKHRHKPISDSEIVKLAHHRCQ
jgi:hypothetical protein